MKLPKYIKVWNLKYRIDVKEVATDEDYVGKCYPHQQVIEIARGLSPQRKVQTLLHECIHAISEEANLKMSEPKVDVLASGIMALFEDNPSLSKLIKSVK